MSAPANKPVKSLLVRGYEVVIGFETHAQLSTRSKIFSRAATAFGAEPNTQACAVDLALPGTLPVMNRGAVERARALGSSDWAIMTRHILPNTVAPLIVQGTYICASAILTEAILSFLGVGLPTDMPTWGNIMAEGRALFRVFPHNILFPGIFLSLAVLAINVIGDGLRDTLDPRMSKRI